MLSVFRSKIQGIVTESPRHIEKSPFLPISEYLVYECWRRKGPQAKEASDLSEGEINSECVLVRLERWSLSVMRPCMSCHFVQPDRKDGDPDSSGFRATPTIGPVARHCDGSQRSSKVLLLGKGKGPEATFQEL